MTQSNAIAPDVPGPPLATRGQVADYLNVAAGTLDQWAHRGIGPRYRLVGGQARYEWADVTSWLDAQHAGGAA